MCGQLGGGRRAPCDHRDAEATAQPLDHRRCVSAEQLHLESELRQPAHGAAASGRTTSSSSNQHRGPSSAARKIHLSAVAGTRGSARPPRLPPSRGRRAGGGAPGPRLDAAAGHRHDVVGRQSSGMRRSRAGGEGPGDRMLGMTLHGAGYGERVVQPCTVDGHGAYQLDATSSQGAGLVEDHVRRLAEAFEHVAARGQEAAAHERSVRRGERDRRRQRQRTRTAHDHHRERHPERARRVDPQPTQARQQRGARAGGVIAEQATLDGRGETMR